MRQIQLATCSQSQILKLLFSTGLHSYRCVLVSVTQVEAMYCVVMNIPERRVAALVSVFKLND